MRSNAFSLHTFTAIPEKNTWGKRQAIYFSMGGLCEFSLNYMGHWCLIKSYYMGGWYGSISNSVGGSFANASRPVGNFTPLGLRKIEFYG